MNYIVDKLESYDADLFNEVEDLFENKAEELLVPEPDRNLYPEGKFHESPPLTNWAFLSDYKLIGGIQGSGACGVVRKCVKRDDPNGQQFAAKMFRRGFNSDGDAEIECSNHLDHPRITKVVDSYIGDRSSSAVMVMRLMPGKDLRSEAESRLDKVERKMFPKETMFDWLT